MLNKDHHFSLIFSLMLGIIFCIAFALPVSLAVPQRRKLPTYNMRRNPSEFSGADWTKAGNFTGAFGLRFPGRRHEPATRHPQLRQRGSSKDYRLGEQSPCAFASWSGGWLASQVSLQLSGHALPFWRKARRCQPLSKGLLRLNHVPGKLPPQPKS